MIFKESKPIYLQIADRICDEILHHKFGEEGRIPSVREYAAMMEVNTNTAMRSYDVLQSQDIIRMKRGIGYFVQPDAIARILGFRKETFMEEEVPTFFHQAYMLGLTAEDIAELYRQYLTTPRPSSHGTDGQTR